MRETLSKLRPYRPHSYWEKRSKRYLQEGLDSSEKAQIALKYFDGMTVVEVGCGPGINFPALNPEVGIDFSMNQLRQIQHFNGDLINADASFLPFRDEAFDGVYLSKVLLHIPHDQIDSVRKEILRVGKKVILLNEPMTLSKSKRLKKHCFNHDHVEGFARLRVEVKVIDNMFMIKKGNRR